MGSRRPLYKMRDMPSLLRIEHEYRYRARFPIVAKELVHDVWVFIPQEDSQVHAGCLRDSDNSRQLSKHVATPSFSQRKYLRGAVRQGGALLEKRDVLE